MKILIIGAGGIIGRKVTEELSKRNEIIKAGRTADVKVDIESADSIKAIFEKLGNIDACVIAAGSVYFGDFRTMTEENMYAGIKSKLMGQVNTVLIGQKYVKDSFTLTSGILSDDPVKHSASAALVNGGLNSFVIGASRELKIRINIVSPGVVEDSAKIYEGFFPGHIPAEMRKVVAAYVKSVEGCATGEIIKVY
jgi:NAD(P)-dependent dehydrogenase (short-subunit alcohol dehydrogenase family)